MTEVKTLNRRIAEIQGWHVEVNRYHGADTYPDRFILFNPQGESTEWDDGFGMDKPSVQFDTEAQAWAHVPDIEHSFDAFLVALRRANVMVTFQPDQPLTVTIYDTSNFCEHDCPKFKVSETDEGLKGADLQRLGAEALYQYLLSKQSLGGES